MRNRLRVLDWVARIRVAGVEALAEGIGISDGSLLTAAQVAKLLGVPTSWDYEQSRRGRIPTVTLGRYRRYRAEAISKWLEELEQSAGGRMDVRIRSTA